MLNSIHHIQGFLFVGMTVNTMKESDDIQLTAKKLKRALKDNLSSAGVVNLTYTNDTQEGISRIRSGKGFKYLYKKKFIKDTETLLRIKSLVIPPAWEKVWICADPNGHLQATGFDNANRKQYKYHPSWSKVRTQTKFYRMLEFGLKLPEMRERIAFDIGSKGLQKEKVLALALSILDTASIRIGNTVYEKLNGSFGLTTLKDKHVKITGTQVKFLFSGKKGIIQNITIKSLKLARIIKKCKELPGKQLFAYIDEQGEVRNIDSGMVNDYIKQISGGTYTAKDFRTWTGSVAAIKAFTENGIFETATQINTRINEVYDIVASILGNTRAICKTHYVHPSIVQHFEQNKLDQFILRAKENIDMYPNPLLKAEERVFIEILKGLKA